MVSGSSQKELIKFTKYTIFRAVSYQQSWLQSWLGKSLNNSNSGEFSLHACLALASADACCYTGLSNMPPVLIHYSFFFFFCVCFLEYLFCFWARILKSKPLLLCDSTTFWCCIAHQQSSMPASVGGYYDPNQTAESSYFSRITGRLHMKVP